MSEGGRWRLTGAPASGHPGAGLPPSATGTTADATPSPRRRRGQRPARRAADAAHLAAPVVRRSGRPAGAGPPGAPDHRGRSLAPAWRPSRAVHLHVSRRALARPSRPMHGHGRARVCRRCPHGQPSGPHDSRRCGSLAASQAMHSRSPGRPGPPARLARHRLGAAARAVLPPPPQMGLRPPRPRPAHRPRGAGGLAALAAWLRSASAAVRPGSPAGVAPGPPPLGASLRSAPAAALGHARSHAVCSDRPWPRWVRRLAPRVSGASLRSAPDPGAKRGRAPANQPTNQKRRQDRGWAGPGLRHRCARARAAVNPLAALGVAGPLAGLTAGVPVPPLAPLPVPRGGVAGLTWRFPCTNFSLMRSGAARLASR